MLVLMYVDMLRNREQFFAISEDAKKLQTRANYIAKKGGYVIKWRGRYKRRAQVTLRSVPGHTIGYFMITRTKPL